MVSLIFNQEVLSLPYSFSNTHDAFEVDSSKSASVW